MATYPHEVLLGPPASAPADRKASASILTPVERRIARWALRLVPSWLESQHLTLMTLGWSAMVLAAALHARSDPRWLAIVSVAIALQYLTDAVDGKVGQLRNAGLVRSGYYMDHLLDYVFLCAILITYGLLLPDRSEYLMTIVLAVAGGFMVSAFLARAVTGVLEISFLGLGPIEMRLVFIGINAWLATVGRAEMLRVVPCVIGAALVVLTVLVYRTQRGLWDLDRRLRHD